MKEMSCEAAMDAQRLMNNLLKLPLSIAVFGGAASAGISL